jgi:uncharacterized membrane protein YeaQ/YmgE (transglycosylase-associated protein family)
MESYAVRQSLRGSIGDIILTLLGSVVAGGLAYGLWAMGEDPAQSPEIQPLLPLGALLLLAVCGALLIAVLYLIIRGVRRTPVVTVDRRGITLGPAKVGGRPRFYPWAHVVQLRIYTLYAGSATDEMPPTHVTYLQVDAADGTSERRDTPAGRIDWGDLPTAMREIAPQVPVQDEGILPRRLDEFDGW